MIHDARGSVAVGTGAVEIGTRRGVAISPGRNARRPHMGVGTRVIEARLMWMANIACGPCASARANGCPGGGREGLDGPIRGMSGHIPTQPGWGGSWEGEGASPAVGLWARGGECCRRRVRCGARYLLQQARETSSRPLMRAADGPARGGPAPRSSPLAGAAAGNPGLSGASSLPASGLRSPR